MIHLGLGDELREEFVSRIPSGRGRGNRHKNGIGLLLNIEIQEGAAVLLSDDHHVHALDGVLRVAKGKFQPVTLVAQQRITRQCLYRSEPLAEVA